MTGPWKRALVTGASSGIGEAMVNQLASEGVEVVVVARRRDRLDALAKRSSGIEVLEADLTVAADVARVVARLQDGAQPIDLLVNNAGFGTSGKVAEIDPGRSADEIELNVKSLVRLTQAVLPGMLERGHGWILNVSSVLGYQPMPDLAVYAATKAFVTSFTEGLHEELRGTGVHATALCPGLTKTEFQSVSSEGSSTNFPAFAWMTAEQVAADGLGAAAKGKAVAVPGPLNKAVVTAADLAPRALMRRLGGLAARR